MTSRDTEIIANFRFRREAVMAQTLLENAGIPSVIQSAEGSGFGPIAGGSNILSRPEHAAEARRILHDAGIEVRDSEP